MSSRARRSAALAAAGVVALAAPLLLAVTDRHLSGAPTTLIASTVAGSLALSVLALQPVLAARRLAWHQAVGLAALVLVVLHVGALFVLSPDDAWFAMSPDGPTRARMAAIALVALLVVATLGLARDLLPLSRTSWRILHAYFASVAIVLGFGHAILTDGALDDAGTAALFALAGFALLAVPVAHAARGRRPGDRA